MAKLPDNQPKSADSIRAALHSISDGNQADEASRRRAIAGPAVRGMADDDRYTIAAFYDHELGRRFQARLTQAGIPAQTAVHQRKLCVEIDFEDSQRAGILYDRFRAAFPDTPPKGIRREYDGVVFGSIIGVTSGSIFLIGGNLGTFELSAPIAMGVLGALIGHLLDRLRSKPGKLRFGVYEFLILATLPAAIIAVWHILARLM